MERDSWIDALVKHVDPEAAIANVSSPPLPQQQPIPPPTPPTVTQSQPSSNPMAGLNRRRSNSRKSSKDVTVTAAQPLASMPASSKFAGAPSPSLFNSMENQRQANGNIGSSSTSNPSSLASQSSSSTFVTPSPSTTTHRELASPPSQIHTTIDAPVRTKRQSMLPSRSSASHSSGPPPSHSAAYLSKLSSDGFNAPPGLPSVGGPSVSGSDKDRERKAKSGRFWPTFGKTPTPSAEKINSRPVFGVPLPETLAIASVANLPAIVFRCIEWLETKRAEEEEGIYRLSGSSAVIKGLKDRFDLEGDVNLLAVDEQWDPHAIAGLLKGFLRELPTSLLTRDLHPRFLAVMGELGSSLLQR